MSTWMRLARMCSILLLTGCVGPAGPVPEADDPDAPVWNAIVVPASGWEPSLGVGADGALFTYAHTDSALTTPGVLNWQVLNIHRSTDDGRTWHSVGTPHRVLPDSDPYLTAGADGTIWSVQMTVPGTCASVATSHDQGATWNLHPAACRGPVYDRPYVVPTEGPHAFLFYMQGPGETVAMRTADHGRTWMPAGEVQRFPLEATAWSGGGFWNRQTGSVFFTFPVQSSGVPLQAVAKTTAPGFAVSRDGGDTFTLGSVGTSGWHDGLTDAMVDGASDDGGTVYLTWTEELQGSLQVLLSHSTDDGRTWSPPRNVTSGDGTRLFPTIAAGAPGKLAIAFYETDAVGHPETLAEDASWNVSLAWTPDASSDAPFARLPLSLEPVHQGPVCVSGNGCSATRELADFFDLDLLPDGRVGAVWTMSDPARGDGAVVYGATAAPILGQDAGA